jgi:hypothetical protein
LLAANLGLSLEKLSQDTETTLQTLAIERGIGPGNGQDQLVARS